MRGVLIIIVLLLSACNGGTPANQASAECKFDEHGSFISIPAGQFTMALDGQYPEEGQPRAVSVAAFEMQSHEVTNAQFAEFVDATAYVTDAEKNLQSPAAGSALFSAPVNQIEGKWQLVKGATWRAPDGPGSSYADRLSHPVVHVSYNDALAYGEWANARLPSEVEWEYVARLGLRNPNDSNSGAFDQQGKPIANTWQGVFPVVDAGSDGFRGAAPVGCYAPNKLGLVDMIGNVWEWTSTPYQAGLQGNYTIKGGSFLCADNFCKRYRPAARQPHEVDFSTNHIGFRVVKAARQ